jgi:hypothetical protein
MLAEARPERIGRARRVEPENRTRPPKLRLGGAQVFAEPNGIR